jgi:hypothetical protein
MTIETLRINCTKSLSLTEFDCEIKATDEFLLAGRSSNDTYRGFLYFDLSVIPYDIIINSCVLKIYIQKSNICGKKSNICFQPLFCDYSNSAIVQSEKDQQRPPISLIINADFHGWLAINVLDIIKNWYNKSLKNYGLLIFADENPKSLFTLKGMRGFNDTNDIMEPNLTIGYVNNCSALPKKNISVYEQLWKFKFYEKEISPPINVELIKQGTFYIDNYGCDNITAMIEISADLCHWLIDNEIVINQNRTSVLVAKYYSKFYRIRLVSTGTSEAVVRFIGQYYT